MAKIRVWDLPTRLLHFALVGGVVVAGLTAGDARHLDLHVASGLVVAATLGLRLVWGLVGTEHARWRAFFFSGSAVRDHLRGLRDGTAPRMLGHNPVASWAMLGGLGLLTLLSLSGLVVLGGEEQEGDGSRRGGEGTGARAKRHGEKHGAG